MAKRAYLKTKSSDTSAVKLAAEKALEDFNSDSGFHSKAVSYRIRDLGGNSQVQSRSVKFLGPHGEVLGSQYLGNFSN